MVCIIGTIGGGEMKDREDPLIEADDSWRNGRPITAKQPLKTT